MNTEHIDPLAITIPPGLPVRRFYPETNSDDAALMQDVRARGVQFPLTVHRGMDGNLTLTSGFRRMRAVRLLIEQGHAVPTVPCNVVEPVR